MTDERKYHDDEVERIFELASNTAETGRPVLSGDAGLTLAEIQDVGREVGMEPGRIAEAALAIDSRAGVLARERFLGMPITAGRRLDLPRDLTDREWEILVGDLRETFGARGHVVSHGGIREWSNGNLQVFSEPTATGHRLRMTTLKGTAKAAVSIGTAGLVIGVALSTLFFFEDLGRAAMVIPTLMTLAGAGTLAANMLRLPRWARRREEQMEYIAGRATALLAEPPPEDAPTPTETTFDT